MTSVRRGRGVSRGGGGLYLVLENIQSILVVQVMKIMFMRKFTNVYIKNIILEKRSNL